MYKCAALSGGSLCTACGGLVPVALVGVAALVKDASREADDLGEDELCDGACVGEGGVEDRDGGDPLSSFK